MNSDKNDPFAYRSQGGRLEIGSGEGDHVSSMIKVDDRLMCITKNNIMEILIADNIDPERTNPEMNHIVQNILPYGSDNEFVGRIFQQADILFKKNSLKKEISCNKGINTSLSFLKEITSLDNLRKNYVKEEDEINSSIEKEPHAPNLPNLEQKVKGFILNTNHACGLIMEMSNIFFSDVKGRGWESKLITKLSPEDQKDFIKFIKSFKVHTIGLRRMRNKVEHPHSELKDDLFNITNYILNPDNTISPPTITYRGTEFNLSKTKVSMFMESTIINLVDMFESLMVYLCSLHAKSFAGDERVVVSVQKDKRRGSEKHIGFQYKIIWTK